MPIPDETLGVLGRQVLRLDAADLLIMADAADAAASLRTANDPVAEPTAAVVTALDGWETAGAVEAARAAWGRKAGVTADSVEVFADGLRATAAAVAARDEQNAIDFTFPEGSPMEGSRPPWTD